MTRRTLSARFAWWVLAYTVVLSGVVLYHGYVFNERVESVVWQTMLEFELDLLIEANTSPGELKDEHGALTLYRADSGSPDSVPPVVRDLPPGVHDDVPINDRESVVLVKDASGQRWYLALDIETLEEEEAQRAQVLTVASVAVGLLLVAGAWFFARQLSGPLTGLAMSFKGLSPDMPSQRLSVTPNATVEEATIAGAMNEYLDRQEQFVRREREFIDTVSHELRTPMAVISGAADVMGTHPAMTPALEPPLRRIRHTADDVTQLINLLLVLARDPRRLAEGAENTNLHDLIPEIVRDHLHLADGKDLVVRTGVLAEFAVAAPPQLLRAAIGNLIRNAIENSDTGIVDVEAPSPGIVRVCDPGHGMTPEGIGALYASVARGGRGRVGHGIGLELIVRLCEHLGWSVRVESRDRGTIATLDMQRAVVAPA